MPRHSFILGYTPPVDNLWNNPNSEISHNFSTYEIQPWSHADPSIIEEIERALNHYIMDTRSDPKYCVIPKEKYGRLCAELFVHSEAPSLPNHLYEMALIVVPFSCAIYVGGEARDDYPRILHEAERRHHGNDTSNNRSGS